MITSYFFPLNYASAMADSDKLGGDKGPPDTFNDIIISGLGSIRWRFFVLLFVVFILISTDVFENRVLSKISGATVDGVRTPWGTTITGLLLVLVCIIIDAGQTHKLI